METSSPENPPPVRDGSFYFDNDPMAVFLVEDRLFKVHRHYFIQGSEIFRDMFSQATNCSEDAATAAEGMSDEKPIVLSQVTVKEFKALLRFFYATTLPIPNQKTLADILAFGQDDKLALLSIAHQFVFDKICEYVCGELKPGDIPLVDRVRLGDKYHLDKWLSSAYQTILERNPDGQMSKEEVDVLGFKRVIKVLEAKNHALQKVYSQLSVVKHWNSNPQHQYYCATCGYMSSGTNEGDIVTAMRSAIAQAVAKLML